MIDKEALITRLREEATYALHHETIALLLEAAHALAAPVPCCGKYETCTQACTPRGKFLGAREAAAQRPWLDLTDEQIKAIDEMALTKNMAIVMTMAALKEINT